MPRPTDIGPNTYYYCGGAQPCIVSGYVELFEEGGGVVGRSAVAIPGP